MKISQEVRILPEKDWKAFRVIHFTINGLSTSFIYQRRIDFNKLSIVSEPDPFWKGKINRIPILPTDDLDDFLLRWISSAGKDATIENRLFVFHESEEIFLKKYEGLPKCTLNLIALPSFGDRTFEELIQLEGQTFTRYCRCYPVHLFGPVPMEKELTISTQYDVSTKKEMDTYINRLDSEIII